MSFLRSAPMGAVAMLLVLPVLAAAPPSPQPNPAVATSAPAALHSAIRQVWALSPQIQAAQSSVEAARARVRAAAQPLYNPAISIESENADVNRRAASLSLTLDISGKRRARVSAAEADLQISRARYERLRRDLSARWLQAWSRMDLATRQRELGARRVALMKRFDKLASKRLKVGDISSPERDLAGLALGEALAQQAELIANEVSVRSVLQEIVGTAAIGMPAVPAGLPPASRNITARVLEELPEMRLARARQARAEALALIARRARIPDPTASITAGRVRYGAITDRIIGVSISIPLPLLNTGRAEVEAAHSESAAVAAWTRSQRLLSQARRVGTKLRYQALRDADLAFRNGRSAAYLERTRLLERLWRASEISTSDYLVQLKQSLDTALSGLQLQSRTWQAWFDYLSSSGRLIDWLGKRLPGGSQ